MYNSEPNPRCRRFIYLWQGTMLLLRESEEVPEMVRNNKLLYRDRYVEFIPAKTAAQRIRGFRVMVRAMKNYYLYGDKP